MNPSVSVARLDLKKDDRLTVEFADGKIAVFPIGRLRSLCPCASCRTTREQQAARPRSLTILTGNYDKPLAVISAELVGNYALRIDWSDNHSSGIYSFAYLREIAE